MILGNFMLLNLFLTILLKSISGEEEETDDADEADLRTSAIDGPPDGSLQDQPNTPLDHEDIDVEEESEGSICLNSSNSNIEEEFEQIKMQLMELSNGLILKNNQITINPDGPIDKYDEDEFQGDESPSADREKRLVTKESQDKKQKKKISKTVMHILALQNT